MIANRTTTAQEQSEQLDGCPAEHLCGCPRQADLWLCHARPRLICTPDGRRCELDLLLDATDSDYWRGPPIGGPQ